MLENVESLSVRIVGKLPLLMHNCVPSLDYEDERNRELKSLTGKHAKSKTDADRQRMQYLEFCMGLYVDDEEQVIVPADMQIATLRSGAKKIRMGKQVEAAVTVLDDAFLYDESGNVYKGVDKLWDTKVSNTSGKMKRAHVDRRAARVQASRVLRIRPRFDRWQFETTFMYLSDEIDRDVLISSLQYAGVMKGIGDYRPRFGTFEVEVVK